MSVLICPNCGVPLMHLPEARVYRCENGHSFDCAKEGYVNLMVGSRSGENRGDSKASARARHNFLNRGYYGCLKQAMEERLHGTVLDICCGEGYYDIPLPESVEEFYGFDLSKEMVRLAAKRAKAAEVAMTACAAGAETPGSASAQITFFVGNLAHIPVRDHSVDVAMHLFAPFHAEEFSRVLKPDGVLYSVIPGENHLFELKKVVYDTPYQNDEQAPEAESLRLVSRTKVSETVTVPRGDLQTLFSMTPYYYRSSSDDRAKLERVDSLDLTVEFVILEYRLREEPGA